VKAAALIVALLILAPVLVLAGLGIYSRRVGPRASGVIGGRLAPCPASPNCVASSEGAGGGQAMEPLHYQGGMAEGKRRLLAVLSEMPGAVVVADDGPYLRAEFRSRAFGFVDDVEFLFDDAAKRIDFRSASRVGYSDLGANRARMTEIARRFAALSGLR
jgi:uncharacterized protein (DUF1499 family)